MLETGPGDDYVAEVHLFASSEKICLDPGSGPAPGTVERKWATQGRASLTRLTPLRRSIGLL